MWLVGDFSQSCDTAVEVCLWNSGNFYRWVSNSTPLGLGFSFLGQHVAQPKGLLTVASDFPDAAASLLTDFDYLHIVLHIVNTELIRLSWPWLVKITVERFYDRPVLHKMRLRMLKNVVSSFLRWQKETPQSWACTEPFEMKVVRGRYSARACSSCWKTWLWSRDGLTVLACKWRKSLFSL